MFLHYQKLHHKCSKHMCKMHSVAVFCCLHLCITFVLHRLSISVLRFLYSHSLILSSFWSIDVCLHAMPLFLSHCHHITLPSHHTAITPHCHHITLPSHHTATISHCHHTTLPSHHTAITSHCHHTTLPSHHTAITPHCHHTIMPSLNILPLGT